MALRECLKVGAFPDIALVEHWVRWACSPPQYFRAGADASSRCEHDTAHLPFCWGGGLSLSPIFLRGCGRGNTMNIQAHDMILTSGDAPVIDLRANYGEKFKVLRDECGDMLIPHKWGPSLRSVLRERPDRKSSLGHFFAYSATEMGCYVSSASGRQHNDRLKRIQARFPIRLTQNGDTETNFVFDPMLFPRLAALVGAYRKPQLSVAESQRRRERMLSLRNLP
jgi:hypothetical protein